MLEIVLKATGYIALSILVGHVAIYLAGTILILGAVYRQRVETQENNPSE
jgi:hypothetical protein